MPRRSVLVVLILSAAPLSAQDVRRLDGHRGPITALAFAPDGRLATGGFDRTVRLRDADGAVERTLTAGSKVLALAWSPDGRLLASAGLDDVLTVWDAAAGAALLRLRCGAFCVHAVAFTPDGTRLVACGEEGCVESWRLEDAPRDAAPLWRRYLDTPLYAAAVAPDGGSLAVAGLDGTVYVFDADSGEERQRLEGHHDAVFGLAFAPDGVLLSASADRTVRRWDVTAGRLLACLDGHRAAVAQTACSGDGRRLVTAGADGEVIVWDTRSGEALHSHRLPGKALSAAFAPDGTAVAAGGERACYLLALPRHVR